MYHFIDFLISDLSYFYPTGVILGCSSAVLVTSQFITGRLSSFNTLWLPSLFSMLLISLGLAMVGGHCRCVALSGKQKIVMQGNSNDLMTL